jgi:hypothetical protein
MAKKQPNTANTSAGDSSPRPSSSAEQDGQSQSSSISSFVSTDGTSTIVGALDAIICEIHFKDHTQKLKAPFRYIDIVNVAGKLAHKTLGIYPPLTLAWRTGGTTITCAADLDAILQSSKFIGNTSLIVDVNIDRKHPKFATLGLELDDDGTILQDEDDDNETIPPLHHLRDEASLVSFAQRNNINLESRATALGASHAEDFLGSVDFGGHFISADQLSVQPITLVPGGKDLHLENAVNHSDDNKSSDATVERKPSTLSKPSNNQSTKSLESSTDSNTAASPNLISLLSNDKTIEAVSNLLQKPELRPVYDELLHAFTNVLIKNAPTVLKAVADVLKDSPQVADALACAIKDGTDKNSLVGRMFATTSMHPSELDSNRSTTPPNRDGEEEKVSSEVTSFPENTASSSGLTGSTTDAIIEKDESQLVRGSNTRVFVSRTFPENDVMWMIQNSGKKRWPGGVVLQQRTGPFNVGTIRVRSLEPGESTTLRLPFSLRTFSDS